jgi:hypothetical protein
MAISSKETPLTRCPACARVYEKNPAGSLLLQGDFALDHRHEILSLIHAIEANEKQDDPLKRIMWIDYQEQGIVVTAASAPLIAAIGEALHDTYGGELDGHTSESAAFLLLRWKS